MPSLLLMHLAQKALSNLNTKLQNVKLREMAQQKVQRHGQLAPSSASSEYPAQGDKYLVNTQLRIFTKASFSGHDKKMVSENCQLEHTCRQLLRAKRISDVEWEAHRERLVELYLNQYASRNEIVDIMAQNHNFIIT